LSLDFAEREINEFVNLWYDTLLFNFKVVSVLSDRSVWCFISKRGFLRYL